MQIPLRINRTNVEFHECVKQVVIREFCSHQRIPQNTFRAVIHGPSSMEQKGYKLRFQVRILDIFGIGQECDAQCNNFVTNSREHDIRYESDFSLALVIIDGHTQEILPEYEVEVANDIF